ncbi:MAG: hypothetical protein RMJ82_14230, partial [Gemmatales bacterium]|nr:hypothetical protein [Gemmatales bacterium]
MRTWQPWIGCGYCHSTTLPIARQPPKIATEPRPKKLLEQVDDAIRLMHYPPRAEETSIRRIKPFILTLWR